MKFIIRSHTLLCFLIPTRHNLAPTVPSRNHHIRTPEMASIRCSSASSAARSFLAVASRSHATTRPAANPLEFLLPRCALAATMPAFAPRAVPMRSFSISATRQATVCVRNPVKDEDGKEMTMEITPRAAKV